MIFSKMAQLINHISIKIHNYPEDLYKYFLLLDYFRQLHWEDFSFINEL